MTVGADLRLLSAEDRYRDATGRRSPAENVVDRFWRNKPGQGPAQLADQPKTPPAGPSTDTAAAYVNHGRWMVDCPYGCGSAQYASRTDHRFFCVECGGHGRWVTVEWPSDLDVSAIEASLLIRPDIRTRNWRPGETVAGLAGENARLLRSPDA